MNFKTILFFIISFFATSSFATEIVFALNYVDNTVTPIYVPTLSTLPVIPTGANPQGFVLTADNKYLLTLNVNGSSVTPIDLSTLTQRDLITVGSFPVAGAATFDNKYALIVNSGSNNVTPIDLATLTALPNIALPGRPSNIAITLDSSYALVTLPDLNQVAPINLTTLLAEAPIAATAGPDGIAITRDNKYALVTNRSGTTVTPILISTFTPQPDILVNPGPFPIAISVLNDYAFVGCASGGIATLVPIYIPTLTPLPPITIDGLGFSFSTNIQVTSDNKYILASTGILTILQMSNFAILDTIPLSPGSLTFCITTDNHYAMIANYSTPPPDPGLVTPIDLSTSAFTQLPQIPVGSYDLIIAATNASFSLSFSPTNISGKQIAVESLFQIDLVNEISWQAPSLTTPMKYKIFRDSALTILAGEVNGDTTEFFDHGRKKGEVYSYYVISQAATGSLSDPSFIQVP